MAKYILGRIVIAGLTLLLILFILFLLLEFMPGSPFNDARMSEDQIRTLNEIYGLNAPVSERFFIYMKNVIFHWDFGVSYAIQKNMKISSIIAARVGVTVQIGLQAIVIGSVVGIFLGVIAGLKRNSLADTLTTIIAVVGVSIPSYVIALGLSFFIGYKLRLLPITFQMGEPFLSTLLPSTALSLFVIAQTARFTRMELIEIIKSDYFKLAEAKGLRKAKLIRRHALKNAMIPIITILGPLLVGLMTGSLVVEKIFGVPGIGSLLINAIQVNDFSVIIAVAFIYSFFYIMANLVIDILYGVFDPRIRVAAEEKQ